MAVVPDTDRGRVMGTDRGRVLGTDRGRGRGRDRDRGPGRGTDRKQETEDEGKKKRKQRKDFQECYSVRADTDKGATLGWEMDMRSELGEDCPSPCSCAGTFVEFLNWSGSNQIYPIMGKPHVHPRKLAHKSHKSFYNFASCSLVIFDKSHQLGFHNHLLDLCIP